MLADFINEYLDMGRAMGFLMILVCGLGAIGMRLMHPYTVPWEAWAGMGLGTLLLLYGDVFFWIG